MGVFGALFRFLGAPCRVVDVLRSDRLSSFKIGSPAGEFCSPLCR